MIFAFLKAIFALLTVAIGLWTVVRQLWLLSKIPTFQDVQKECDELNRKEQEEWEKLPEEKKRDPKWKPLPWRVHF